MSKRVTTQTEITDSSIFTKAVASCGIKSSKIDDNTYELRTAHSIGILNLKTGSIEGDDMSFRSGDFDTLKQHYAEKKYMWELEMRGASVHSRTVDREGNIVITYQIA